MNAGPVFIHASPIETPEQKRDRLLLEWQEVSNTLSVAKDAEMTKRNEVFAYLFPNPIEGTQYFDLPGNWKVKLVYKMNYKIDSDSDKVDAAIDIMSKMGPTGAVIADRLFKWKADVSVTEYRTLIDRDEKFKNDPNAFAEYGTESRVLRELQAVLTIKPGAPTLELIDPDEKKKRK